MTRTGQAACDYARGRVGHDMPAAGYCLQLVRECFDLPAVYASADQAWTHAERKHPGDRHPPPAVPLWFATPSPYDHVVIHIDDHDIVTTFNEEVRLYQGPDAIAAIERDFQGTYQGWAETLNGFTVWMEDDDMTTYDDVVRAVVESLRAEGVSGAGDPALMLNKGYRQGFTDAVGSVVKSEGISGAADGTQPWAQVYVRDIVADETSKALRTPQGGRTWRVALLALVLVIAVIIGLIVAVTNDAAAGTFAGGGAAVAGVAIWLSVLAIRASGADTA